MTQSWACESFFIVAVLLIARKKVLLMSIFSSGVHFFLDEFFCSVFLAALCS
jgi:hypothetical protein